MRISRVLCAALISAGALFSVPSRASASVVTGVCSTSPPTFATFSPGLPVVAASMTQLLTSTTLGCTMFAGGAGTLSISGRFSGVTSCLAGALTGEFTVSFSSGTNFTAATPRGVLTNNGGVLSATAAMTTGEILFTGEMQPQVSTCPSAWSATLYVTDGLTG